MKKAKGIILAKSLRSLALKTGRSLSAVRKWMDRDDWTFGRDPRVRPFNVGKVMAWMEVALKPDPAAAYRKKIRAAEAGRGEFADMGPLTKARIQATIERALWIRQERELRGRRLHRNEDCAKKIAALVHKAKTAFVGMGRSLRNSLVGQDGDTIERVIDERVLAILLELEGGATEAAGGN